VLGIDRVLLHAAWVELPDEVRVVSPLPIELGEIWRALGGDEDSLQRAENEPVMQ
jgi:hypothetical protein